MLFILVGIEKAGIVVRNYIRGSEIRYVSACENVFKIIMVKTQY